MTPAQSQCTACTHLHREEPQPDQCDAFPKGIPDEILLNRVMHDHGYPGDGGIHLELIPLDQYQPPHVGQA